MPQDRPDIPIGETVTVTLTAAVVVTNTPLVVQLGAEVVTVPNGVIGVVDVEVVNPANWPPQPVDVWSGGDGTSWFGVQVANAVKLVDAAGGNPQNVGAVKQAHRPLTLVYRAG